MWNQKHNNQPRFNYSWIADAPAGVEWLTDHILNCGWRAWEKRPCERSWKSLAVIDLIERKWPGDGWRKLSLKCNATTIWPLEFTEELLQSGREAICSLRKRRTQQVHENQSLCPLEPVISKWNAMWLSGWRVECTLCLCCCGFYKSLWESTGWGQSIQAPCSFEAKVEFALPEVELKSVFYGVWVCCKMYEINWGSVMS